MDTVAVEVSGSVAVVRLSRPQVRNAFNPTLMEELPRALGEAARQARVIILRGAGTSFSAGADVSWMRESKGYTERRNVEDAGVMAAMLRAVDECPLPVIARVEGIALGGGCGLVAAADIAIAAEGTQFGFTEVRLGLIPAVISTFVLPKIGVRSARRYFLTGERFGAAEALSMGLVHEVVAPGALDEKVNGLASELLRSGPEAVGEAKRLLRQVGGMTRPEAIAHTIQTIARIRVSPEAQEGLSAFLEKRRPTWS
jgi:methylglutaconyl-CoA hydratase